MAGMARLLLYYDSGLVGCCTGLYFLLKKKKTPLKAKGSLSQCKVTSHIRVAVGKSSTRPGLFCSLNLSC